MTKIESVIEPDGVADYVPRESVTFIGIHASILSITASYLSAPKNVLVRRLGQFFSALHADFILDSAENTNHIIRM
jgi:hypothetical protein